MENGFAAGIVALKIGILVKWLNMKESVIENGMDCVWKVS
jgi:hypothetical protein